MPPIRGSTRSWASSGLSKMGEGAGMEGGGTTSGALTVELLTGRYSCQDWATRHEK